jgi:hypothetical protein
MRKFHIPSIGAQRAVLVSILPDFPEGSLTDDERKKQLFEKDLEILAGIIHINFAKVIGYCRDGPEGGYQITEAVCRARPVPVFGFSAGCLAF